MLLMCEYLANEFVASARNRGKKKKLEARVSAKAHN